MLEGLLVKAKGGFYFVMVAEGNILRCRARGRLKDEGVYLLVGDKVEINCSKDGDGVIERVFPRNSALNRPPVANADQAVVVVALREPSIDLHLLHRVITAASLAGISVTLCFNKIDLITLAEDQAIMAEYVNTFKSCGYKVVCTSSLTGEGMEEMRAQLTGRISVLAGPSGTGKSTLLNKLSPGLALKSGSLSQKLARGRHTTRHVELIAMGNNTLVADTPGFQRLDAVPVPPRKLAALFPEIHLREGLCRYRGCLHRHEPACAVKEAVQQAEIVSWRYDQYLVLLEEAVRQENIH